MASDFAFAAGLAAAQFFKEGVPDGGYLKIEPLPDPQVEDLSADGSQGWPKGEVTLVAQLITDMYGPHPTIIGYIAVLDPDTGDHSVVWQDL